MEVVLFIYTLLLPWGARAVETRVKVVTGATVKARDVFRHTFILCVTVEAAEA